MHRQAGIPEGGQILIMPGETVLGITRERIRLGQAFAVGLRAAVALLAWG